MLTLKFLASGNFYINVAEIGGIHKSTCGKIVQRVVCAIANLRPRYIKFPVTEPERQAAVLNFAQIARFPRVLGAIDCTHVKIQSPGKEIRMVIIYLILMSYLQEKI